MRVRSLMLAVACVALGLELLMWLVVDRKTVPAYRWRAALHGWRERGTLRLAERDERLALEPQPEGADYLAWKERCDALRVQAASERRLAAFYGRQRRRIEAAALYPWLRGVTEEFPPWPP